MFCVYGVVAIDKISITCIYMRIGRNLKKAIFIESLNSS